MEVLLGLAQALCDTCSRDCSSCFGVLSVDAFEAEGLGMYLDLQHTQENGLYPKIQGLRANMLGTWQVQVPSS